MMKIDKSLFELPQPPIYTDLWKELAVCNRPIVIYGMGDGADKLIKKLSSIGVAPVDFFASDDFVRGQFFHGKKVLTFKEILKKYKDFVVLVSFGTRRQDVLKKIYLMDKRYDVYVPDMPVCGDVYFDSDFYNKNYRKIMSALHLLKDKHSKNTLCALVNYKLTGQIKYLKAARDDKDAWLSFLTPERYRNTVDAGAYDGDTIRELMYRSTGLKTIVAIEPDKANYKKLVRFCRSNKSDTIIIPYNGCAWDKSGFADFSSSGNRNSSLTSTSFVHKEDRVPLYRIDDLVENRHIDYIKYDVEGAELQALRGSKCTICRCLPDLMVSMYHRSEDMFSIIRYIHKLSDKYIFRILRPECLPAWETSLYAYVSASDRVRATGDKENFIMLLSNVLASYTSDSNHTSAVPCDEKKYQRHQQSIVPLAEKKEKKKKVPEDLGYILEVFAEIFNFGDKRSENIAVDMNAHTNLTFTASSLAAHIQVEIVHGKARLMTASTRKRSWIYDAQYTPIEDGASTERTFFMLSNGDSDMNTDEIIPTLLEESICLKINIKKSNIGEQNA